MGDRDSQVQVQDGVPPAARHIHCLARTLHVSGPCCSPLQAAYMSVRSRHSTVCRQQPGHIHCAAKTLHCIRLDSTHSMSEGTAWPMMCHLSWMTCKASPIFLCFLAQQAEISCVRV